MLQICKSCVIWKLQLLHLVVLFSCLQAGQIQNSYGVAGAGGASCDSSISMISWLLVGSVVGGCWYVGWSGCVVWSQWFGGNSPCASVCRSCSSCSSCCLSLISFATCQCLVCSMLQSLQVVVSLWFLHIWHLHLWDISGVVSPTGVSQAGQTSFWLGTHSPHMQSCSVFGCCGSSQPFACLCWLILWSRLSVSCSIVVRSSTCSAGSGCGVVVVESVCLLASLCISCSLCKACCSFASSVLVRNSCGLVLLSLALLCSSSLLFCLLGVLERWDCSPCDWVLSGVCGAALMAVVFFICLDDICLCLR